MAAAVANMSFVAVATSGADTVADTVAVAVADTLLCSYFWC